MAKSRMYRPRFPTQWERGRRASTEHRSCDSPQTGTDGCNDLSGRWTQDSTGRIYLEALLPRTTNVCDGVDTWLIGGRSADILDDFMYVNGDMDSPIGGLQPAH